MAQKLCNEFSSFLFLEYVTIEFLQLTLIHNVYFYEERAIIKIDKSMHATIRNKKNSLRMWNIIIDKSKNTLIKIHDVIFDWYDKIVR